MTRPNVLWIITDDQPRHLLGKMARVQTRLVDQGIRFARGYTAVPWCGPARASMLTGMYPHNHGCLDNGTLPDFKDVDNDTVATRMQAAGYRTGYFGKFINSNGTDPEYVAPGFDRYVTTIDDDLRYNVDGKIEMIDSVAKIDQYAATRAKWFINQNPETGKPFFAIFAPRSPHAPFTPSAEHEHDYDNLTWDPPAFNETSMADKPTWLHGIPMQDREKMRSYVEGMSEELQDTDEQVDMLLDALQETGQLADTFIFYVSDNGYLFGEHRLFKKEQPYEESSGIPFVVRGPGVAQGNVNYKLVSQVDLMPTTLDIAGLDPDAGRELDGRSMLAGLRGDWSGWRDRMLVENPYLGWAMLCEGSERFVDHYSKGQWECYDIATDPHQLTSKNGIDPAPRRAKLAPLRSGAGQALRAAE
jgi:N-acetylglucosamine-6-sulfatase